MICNKACFVLPGLLLVVFAGAQQNTSASSETAWGLHTITFQTPQGKILVNLPDDAAAGDTIVLTVLEQPAGQNASEKQKDRDELDGYVVEIQDQGEPAKHQSRKFAIPAAAAWTVLPVILRRDGQPVARSTVPVQGRVSSPANEIKLPPLGQAGRPNSINGPFEPGANYATSVGGQQAPILAVSPRKLVFQAPADVVGPADVELKRDDSSVARKSVNFVKISLSSPKTTLLRGERTTVTATVTGLEGLPKDRFPLPVEMTCTAGVRFEGGSGDYLVQEIAYQDSKPDAAGHATATISTSMEGVLPGTFAVHAAVQPGALGGDDWKAAKDLIDNDSDFGKWIDGVQKDLDNYISKLGDSGPERDMKQHARDVKDRLEGCKNMTGAELDKKKDCADLCLRGIHIVQIASGLWVSGFETLESLYKALLLQKPPWDVINKGMDFMIKTVEAGPTDDKKKKKDILKKMKAAKEAKEAAEKAKDAKEIKENVDKATELLNKVKDYFKGSGK